jgi:hypothetical protein
VDLHIKILVFIKNNKMKKLLIIIGLAIISIVSYCQNKTWEWSLDVTHSIDTVIHPGRTWDLSDYSWSGTIETEGLSDTLKIGIGTSNKLLRSTPQIEYAIENFPHWIAFPYNFIPDNQILITNEDTTCQQSWSSGDNTLNFKSIGVRLETTGDTVFTVNGSFNFTKR